MRRRRPQPRRVARREVDSSPAAAALGLHPGGAVADPSRFPHHLLAHYFSSSDGVSVGGRAIRRGRRTCAGARLETRRGGEGDDGGVDDTAGRTRRRQRPVEGPRSGMRDLRSNVDGERLGVPGRPADSPPWPAPSRRRPRLVVTGGRVGESRVSSRVRHGFEESPTWAGPLRQLPVLQRFYSIPSTEQAY